ncbi:MAG: AMP-binding protein [Gemmatimonadota bacterium]
MSSSEAFLRARDFLLRHRSDHEAACRGFRWPALETFNWALDYFDPYARDNERTALWLVREEGAEVRLSFAELAERSTRLADYLEGLDFRRGDRVLLMLENVPELWVSFLACMKLGAVMIPATTQLQPKELEDRIARGRVRHIITASEETGKFSGLAGGLTRIAVGEPAPGWQSLPEAEELPAAARQPPEAAESAEEAEGPGAHGGVARTSARTGSWRDAPTRATDPLLLYFTSGTTSRPKLVAHTHASYPVGHLSTMYWIGLRAGDVHWNISSPGWAKHAWSSFFAPWNAGATVFVYAYRRFEPAAALRVLARCGVTTLCAPPTVWRLLIQEGLAEHEVRLREAVSAGEPLNPEVIARVQEGWGITVRDGYGQTETTAQIGNSPGQPVKPGSMGRPLPGYHVRLLGPTGDPGEGGEICVGLDPRPTGLMAGYSGAAELTDEVVRESHYHTGDVATRDEEGYFWYVGRTDDLFKSSDYRISPFELESVLIEHPAVAEAAVVPSPHPLRLTVPKAFVRLTEGFEPGPETAREIFSYVRGRLAPFKRVRRLEFAELPKTISGKIRRVDLRTREAARESGEERREWEFWEEDVRGLRRASD